MMRSWTSWVLLVSAVMTLAAGAFGQEATVEATKADETQATPKKIVLKKDKEGGEADSKVEVIVAPDGGIAKVYSYRLDGDHPAALPAYWLGISGEPAGQTVLAQLKLEAALAVTDVVDNSPATKAGLKQHDLILSIGQKKVGEIGDVVAALKDSKGEETELTVVRGGEKLAVKITPEKRPEGAAGAEFHHSDEAIAWLKKMGQGNDGVRLWSFRPGMVLGHDHALQLPGKTTVTIRKEGDGPAKIEVTHEDQKYETTEDNLDALPEKLRDPIRHMLKGQGPISLRFDHHLPAVPGGLENELKLRVEGLKEKVDQIREGAKGEERQTIIVPRVRVERAEAASGAKVAEGKKSIEAQLEMLIQKMEKIEKELAELKERK